MAIDLSIYFVRLLHVSIIFKSLGPKLVMIEKMVYDLIFFIVIISVFVLTFGIITQATLYPGNTFDFNLLKSIFNKAYWPIYGDLTLLHNIILCKSNDCYESETKPAESGVYLTYLATVIYMILVYVLLLNLLIAMFRY